MHLYWWALITQLFIKFKYHISIAIIDIIMNLNVVWIIFIGLFYYKLLKCISASLIRLWIRFILYGYCDVVYVNY